MGFVDDDEAKVGDGGEKRGARANDDLGRGSIKRAFPELVTDGFSLGGMEDGNRGEMGLEIAYELRGEGDFGDENNNGFVGGEALASQFNIDIGFAGAGDAVQENGVGGTGIDFLNGALLGGIKRVVDRLMRGWRFGLEIAALFGEAAREHRLDDARERAAIIVAEPEHCLDEAGGEGLVVNNARDGFSGEVGCGGFGGDDAESGRFTEGDFDELANFKWDI